MEELLKILAHTSKNNQETDYRLIQRYKEDSFMPQAKIGVIGGTGLYEIEGITDIGKER
jgi:purine nucleoside phosphorylase